MTLTPTERAWLDALWRQAERDAKATFLAAWLDREVSIARAVVAETKRTEES